MQKLPQAFSARCRHLSGSESQPSGNPRGAVAAPSTDDENASTDVVVADLDSALHAGNVRNDVQRASQESLGHLFFSLDMRVAVQIRHPHQLSRASGRLL